MSQKEPARRGLDSRVVVVTDADGTRGADIARAMATTDAVVVLTGDDTDALATLASEIASAGARVAVLVDDVATEAGRNALVEMVGELFPPRNT
jgi:NADP-dependent 3-hydroxy acid dehydrogenase YdfG